MMPIDVSNEYEVCDQNCSPSVWQITKICYRGMHHILMCDKEVSELEMHKNIKKNVE